MWSIKLKKCQNLGIYANLGGLVGFCEMKKLAMGRSPSPTPLRNAEVGLKQL